MTRSVRSHRTTAAIRRYPYVTFASGGSRQPRTSRCTYQDAFSVIPESWYLGFFPDTTTGSQGTIPHSMSYFTVQYMHLFSLR